ncbi:MAG: proton-conducting transporter transmembrane domain-containing protein, partial [Planctomycetota bacterium]
MEQLLALPIAIPLVGAGLCLAVARSLRAQALICIGGMVALTLSALAIFDAVRSEDILVLQSGAWPAPFGISLVADPLSAVLLLMSSIVGVAVAVYSVWAVDRDRRGFFYFPLLLVLMLGVQGSFLTGDLFNLYVCFEVMLMASFVLLTLGGDRRQMEGGVKYVILNLLSSAIFLTATGLLYGAVGTLNMADLSVQIARSDSPEVMNSLAMLFLVAFGLKAALFPFSFWLPASYHTPPFAVSAI